MTDCSRALGEAIGRSSNPRIKGFRFDAFSDYNIVLSRALQMQRNTNKTSKRNVITLPKIKYGRWLHLIGVAERLSEISRGACSDYKELHVEIVKNLIGLNEVFSRDIDPVSDLEGYAVRRLSQEIINLLEIKANYQKT